MFEYYRIGNKHISISKLNRTVEKIFELREKGLSQQETAERTETDRVFISKLEKLGEIRKGGRIAVIAFPILNKEELIKTAKEYGAELTLIMTEKERWGFLEKKSGIELFNEIMELLTYIRSFDTVILMGSNKRIKLIERFIDSQTFSIEIGQSPLEEDVYVNPKVLQNLLVRLKSGGESNETYS